MKITFPYWGNYTIAFKALFEKLGLWKLQQGNGDWHRQQKLDGADI